MQHTVAVTGAGIISSIGSDVASFGQSLRRGRSGIVRVPAAAAAGVSVDIAAMLSDFDFDACIESRTGTSQEVGKRARRCAGRSPLPVQTSVAAALEAWLDAGLHDRCVPAERVGLVAGGHNVTDKYQLESAQKFARTPEYVSPRFPLHALDTDHVGTLSEVFGICGEGFTAGGASASGNVAIVKGCQMIQLGLAEVCLVVGIMADLSPVLMQGFYNLGAMGGKRFLDRPDCACRPFDRAAEGFIYGQAAAALVLESPSAARQRGISAHCEVAGGATMLHGHALTEPGVDGEARAMRAALAQADAAADDVTYINAHGTSAPAGDAAEVAALRKVFGDALGEIYVNATKGLTGHCLCAAGVAEAVAVMVQMKDGFIHPNVNLDAPIADDCRFADATAVEADTAVAISNSFGFGGINSCLVLRRGNR